MLISHQGDFRLVDIMLSDPSAVILSKLAIRDLMGMHYLCVSVLQRVNESSSTTLAHFFFFSLSKEVHCVHSVISDTAL